MSLKGAKSYLFLTECAGEPARGGPAVGGGEERDGRGHRREQGQEGREGQEEGREGGRQGRRQEVKLVIPARCALQMDWDIQRGGYF